MKTASLTQVDRIGIFFGTVMFLLMLPLTIFVSTIPAVAISNAISNKVVALTVNVAFLGAGTLMTLLVALVAGLATSYGLAWVGRKLQLPQAYAAATQGQRPIEASRKVNIGAMGGLALGVIVFLANGQSPIQSVTQRVEHLFPGPLVLSLGNLFTFDLSHTYAALTGFLSVGFLFAIVGIALGGLVFAAIEAMTARNHR